MKKKWAPIVALMLVSTTCFAADECDNFGGNWIDDSSASQTFSGIVDAWDSSVALYPTSVPNTASMGFFTGYCLNGTIILRNFNSVYLGTINGNRMVFEGHNIPDSSVLYTMTYTKQEAN